MWGTTHNVVHLMNLGYFFIPEVMVIWFSRTICSSIFKNIQILSGQAIVIKIIMGKGINL